MKSILHAIQGIFAISAIPSSPGPQYVVKLGQVGGPRGPNCHPGATTTTRRLVLTAPVYRLRHLPH